MWKSHVFKWRIRVIAAVKLYGTPIVGSCCFALSVCGCPYATGATTALVAIPGGGGGAVSSRSTSPELGDEPLKTRSDGDLTAGERGYAAGSTAASPWPALGLGPVDLDPVAAAWGRKLYHPGPTAGSGPHRPAAAAAAAGLMFGLHHHQEASLHHHHATQPRGPVTSLKEEPISGPQLTVARSWMQPSGVDQNR